MVIYIYAYVSIHDVTPPIFTLLLQVLGKSLNVIETKRHPLHRLQQVITNTTGPANRQRCCTSTPHSEHQKNPF